MEITLEKIELVKDRTGVTYKEAKEALEAADGNVVDAIIAIEETVDINSKKKLGDKGQQLVDKMKEIVAKGNVSKIVVTKDGETIINIPLNVGVIGAVVAPWGVIAGVVASFGFKCQISFIKDDGSVIDVTEKAGEFYEEAKDKGSVVYGDLKEKGAAYYEEVKAKAPGVYEDLKEKGTKAYNDIKEKAMDKINDLKDDDDDCDKDCEHCDDPCEVKCEDCKYDEFHKDETEEK